MTRNKALTFLVVLLALASSLCEAQPAAPAPSFTISATNVTMPSSGIVSIPFTLTSVNGFTGSLTVGITPPTVPVGTRLPYLDIGGPVIGHPLAANATVTGSIGVLAAIPVPVPVKLNLPNRPGRGEAVRWELAGVLMLGLGSLRKRSLRKRARQSTRLLLALCMLIALTGISACGGPPTLTPGTYTYILTATAISASVLSPSASTTVSVTIPPGIVTR
jgi:hypothetical protein